MNELIICAQLNEGALQEPNSRVPFTADAIATDAKACRDAGASIVHAHARGDDGSLDNSVPGYVEMLAAIRGATDVLIAPPLLNGPGLDDGARLGVLAAADQLGFAAADFLVVEMGTSNFDLFDSARREFASTDRVFTTTTRSQIAFIEEAERRGIPVLATSFGAAWSRAIGAHRAAGRLPGRLLVMLVHGGEEFIATHPADVAGLTAHRALLPADSLLEWMVSAHRGNVLDLADEVIASGGHIAVGLGDYPHVERGLPSNAELIAEVVSIGRRYGREPATPDIVRDWFARSHAAATR